MGSHCPACGKCWCCGRTLIEVQPRLAPFYPFTVPTFYTDSTFRVMPNQLTPVTVTFSSMATDPNVARIGKVTS